MKTEYLEHSYQSSLSGNEIKTSVLSPTVQPQRVENKKKGEILLQVSESNKAKWTAWMLLLRVPPNLATKEVKRALWLWLIHKEATKPVKSALQLQALLLAWEKVGPDELVSAVYTSIENGWSSLYAVARRPRRTRRERNFRGEGVTRSPKRARRDRWEHEATSFIDGIARRARK